MPRKSIDKWQFGDFQTPFNLAKAVVAVLKQNHKIQPDVIIEPTCGKGTFIRACCEGFQKTRILGFEINPQYIKEANQTLKDLSIANRAAIKQTDFFNTDWNKIISGLLGHILVIGNPPWVTSSDLGTLDSRNIPEKSNYQNRKGIEAITGSGNFDISEWMILQHLDWFSKRPGTIAFLCKYAIARKIIQQIKQNPKHRFSGHIYPINAKAHFQASVEACLFVLTTDTANNDCAVYESLDSVKPSQIISERDGYIVNDIKNYTRWRHLRGQNTVHIWRSGIKHDCSSIMELEPIEDKYKSGQNIKYKNGLDEIIDCEDLYIYPLLKGSDIGNGRTKSYRKVLLVTQKTLGENTSEIRETAPKTWNYLVKHREQLNKRRSSIYRNKPDFSIFGVGEYSFKQWKIAISGLYKKLNFHLVGPLDGKSVAFDDTINFLSFNTEQEARFIYQIITSTPALEFLESMIFWNEKRPITAQLLKRLSLQETARKLDLLPQYHQWNRTHYSHQNNQMGLGII